MPHGLEHRLVRLEPLALMLPSTHPLAGMDRVPMEALAGVEIDVNPAHPEARDWVDIAGQLLERVGAVATPPHLPAVGRRTRPTTSFARACRSSPGSTTSPSPAASSGRSRIRSRSSRGRSSGRAGSIGSLVAAVLEAAGRLADDERWLEAPEDAWLPEPEASSTRGMPSRP